MNRRWIWFLLLALLTPVIFRTLWLYRGVYQPAGPLEAPDYASFVVDPISVEASRSSSSSSTEGQPLVLLDYQHDNQFALAEIQSLLDTIRLHGGRVEPLVDSFELDSTPLTEHLKAASAWVTIAPTRSFSDSEIEELRHFAANGGRLVVITDPTRSGIFFDPFFSSEVDSFSIGDVTAANGLIDDFGMRFSDDYLYNILENEGNFRNVFLQSVGTNQINEEIGQIVFYGSRSVAGDGIRPVFTGDENTLSSRSDQGGSLVGAAMSGDGSVLAMGDLTFLTPPYDQVGENPILIENLVRFLLTSQRSRGITDYPHFFNKGTLLLTSGDSLPLAAETLPLIQQLRESLLASGSELITTIHEDEDPPAQEIFVGLYESEELPKSILRNAGVTLPADSESGSLEIKGLGEVRATDTSLSILEQDGETINLVILTDTNKNLLVALDIFIRSDYSGCLLSNTLVLCSVGPGDGLGASEFDEFDFDNDLFLDDFEESIPLEETPPTTEPGE